MMRVFQRGADPKRLLAREDLREQFLGRVTKVFQAGHYDSAGLPVQHCGAIPGQTLAEYGGELLQRIQGGELITADQISGLFPKPPVEVYRDETPVDDQYLSIFRVVPSNRGSEPYRKDTYTVKFKEMALGEEAKMATYSGVISHLANKDFETLIGYSDKWLADGDMNLIEELTAATKEAAYEFRAEYFYTMLGTLNANSTAYATDWIKSLNAAIARLERNKKLKPNQTPVVSAPVEMAGLLLEAVKNSLVIGARGNRLVRIPDLLFTTYLAAASPVLVTPPKSAGSDFIDQEREALNAVQSGPGHLRMTKVNYRMRFAGLPRSTKAMEKITY